MVHTSPVTNRPLSLLWPTTFDGRRERKPVDPRLEEDLDLTILLSALSDQDHRRERWLRQAALDLQTDLELIRYRQDAFDDVWRSKRFQEHLAALLPDLSGLQSERPLGRTATWSVLRVVERLAYLELYVRTVERFEHALHEVSHTSHAWETVQQHVDRIWATEEFQQLRRELPTLRAILDDVRSISIGINLSDDLIPESAAIMAVDRERIEGRGTLLDRLFAQDTERRGITPLRSADVNIYSPDNRLFRDLMKLLETTIAPVGQAIDRYAAIEAGAFSLLEPEIAFFLASSRFFLRLEEVGLPTCKPAIAPPEARVAEIDGLYNPCLALRLLESTPQSCQQLVVNDVVYNDNTARVWILTGPNRGGKTTFTRAIGLAHVLFQLGVRIPGREGRLSPVDVIFTHFPSPEIAETGHGRLDEEARRLAEIFKQATPQSLILLNEVLTGTSAVESLALAIDAVRGLRLLGVRAIYTTHLHDLALSAERINQMTPGESIVASLVAEVEPTDDRGQSEHRRTYCIRPGPPLGVSYASEIAEQHGISYPQLRELLVRRGVVRHALLDAVDVEAPAR